MIIAVGALCYANTFHVPFILDDVSSILVNPQITSLSFSLKPRILGELSFALNYNLHGLSLPEYHLVNLLLHMANASLLYVFVLTIFLTPVFRQIQPGKADRCIALAAAFIFVAHPLQTAAVTYLAQRVTLIATLFYLFAVVVYLKARVSKEKWSSTILLLLSLCSATAALLSKEIAVTIPVAILFCEATFFSGNERKRFLLWTIYFIPLVSAVLLTNHAIFFKSDLSSAVMTLTAERGAPPRLDYLLTQFQVLLYYLRLFLYPAGLNLDHDVTLRRSLTDPGVVAAFICIAVLVLLTLLFLIKGRKGENLFDRLWLLAGFGIGWFFITIFVESSLIPVRDVMFDHRVYLPAVGLVMTASVGIWLIVSRRAAQKRVFRRFVTTIVILVLILAVTTISRNRVWQSEVTLWEDAASKSPAKGRTHGALGHAYQRAGRIDDAVRAYSTAVRLSPGDYIARNNLGAIYLKQKKYTDAINELEKVIELAPASAPAHFNLGLAYSASGRFKEGEISFLEAVKLKPDYREALDNLAVIRKTRER